MNTIKKIGTPNPAKKATQLIYEFYNGSKLIGKAIYDPSIYKAKLSLQIKHDNNSPFYKMWKSNYQNGGTCKFNKTNALSEFNKWYKFLTE